MRMHYSMIKLMEKELAKNYQSHFRTVLSDGAKITSVILAWSFARWLRCSLPMNLSGSLAQVTDFPACSVLLTDPWTGYARRSRLASGQKAAGFLARSSPLPVDRLVARAFLGAKTTLAQTWLYIRIRPLIFLLASTLMTSCSSPRITAVNLNDKHAPEGLPYYLPKPYLFVTKNIRYIPTPTVGLTGTAPISPQFDSSSQAAASSPASAAGDSGSKTNQSASAKAKKSATNSAAKARDNTLTAGEKGGTNNPAPVAESHDGSGDQADNASLPALGGNGGPVNFAVNPGVVPPASISDGLIPQEFYTYQIIYLPDRSQKYGLRVKGGYGQLRATVNFVNGWMFTGLGPLGINTSSAAQTVAATGQAVGSVVEAAGQIALNAFGIPSLGGGGSKNVVTSGSTGTNGIPAPPATPVLPGYITNFAELYVFEQAPDGSWLPLSTNVFGRDVIALQGQSPAGASGTGEATPDVSQTETNIENAIRTQLQGDWKFTAPTPMASITFPNGKDGGPYLSIRAKAIRTGGAVVERGDAAKLKSDIGDALTNFLTKNSLQIYVSGIGTQIGTNAWGTPN